MTYRFPIRRDLSMATAAHKESDIAECPQVVREVTARRGFCGVGCGVF